MGMVQLVCIGTESRISIGESTMKEYRIKITEMTKMPNGSFSTEEKLGLSCEGTERLVADLIVAIADTIYSWYKSQDMANKGLAK